MRVRPFVNPSAHELAEAQKILRRHVNDAATRRAVDIRDEKKGYCSHGSTRNSLHPCRWRAETPSIRLHTIAINPMSAHTSVGIRFHQAA